MDAVGMVERRRAAAEDRMTSRCSIMRATGATTPLGDVFVPEWATVDVEVPVQIAGPERDAGAFRVIRVGETETAVAARTAKMPARYADLRDDDLLEVYKSEAGLKVYRVLEASWQDQATSRRVPVIEVDRPEEWGAWG